MASSGVNGYGITAEANVNVAVKASADTLFKIYENAVTELPKLLPEVYKSITAVSENPPTFTTEFTEGCPIKTQTEVVVAVDKKTKHSTYKVIGGDLMDYYNYFRYTESLVALPGGGTRVNSNYQFDKKDGEVGPPFVEFFMANLIKLDQVIDH